MGFLRQCTRRLLLGLSLMFVVAIHQTTAETLTDILRPQPTAATNASTARAATPTGTTTAAPVRQPGAARQAGTTGPAGFIPTGAKPAKAGKNDTYCLTATNLTTNAKAEPVGLAKCNRQKPEGQAWQLRFNGALSLVNTEKCLDADKAALKSQIIVADCNPDSMSQKWFLDGLGRLHTYANPDLCIDVAAAAAKSPSMAYDAQSGFILYECSTRMSQYFIAQGLYPGEFRAARQRIGLRANGQCLDTYDYQSTTAVSKRAAIVSECGANVPTQFWTYSVVNGYLANSGLEPTNTYCLQASGDSPGSAVHVMKCGTTANTMPTDLKDSQRWFRDAFLRLRPYSAPELCIEVFKNSALPEIVNKGVAVNPDDLVLVLNQCRASTAQQWLGEQARPANGTARTAARQAAKRAAVSGNQTAAVAAAAKQPGMQRSAVGSVQPGVGVTQQTAQPAVAAVAVQPVVGSGPAIVQPGAGVAQPVAGTAVTPK